MVSLDCLTAAWGERWEQRPSQQISCLGVELLGVGWLSIGRRGADRKTTGSMGHLPLVVESLGPSHWERSSMDFNAEQNKAHMRFGYLLSFPSSTSTRAGTSTTTTQTATTTTTDKEGDFTMTGPKTGTCKNEMHTPSTISILPSVFTLTTTFNIRKSFVTQPYRGSPGTSPCLFYKRPSSSPSPPRPKPRGHSPGSVSPKGPCTQLQHR